MCVIKRFGWVMCTYAFVEKEGERETGKVFEKQRERKKERERERGSSTFLLEARFH